MVNLPGLLTSANRQVFLQLAAQYRLPTVSQFREFAAEGWLISYGSNLVEQSRRAAFYVDRLLRGAKVSDLPVEFPTKFELIINVKTAKALGLAIPPTLLAIKAEVAGQSALAPENLTTLAHFSVSSTTSLAKSAVDPGSTVSPKSANLVSIFGSAKAALISMLSLSMIAAGVFLAQLSQLAP
jgi:hypothetical protein